MLEKIAPFFIAFILLCIIAEATYSTIKQKKLYNKKDTWTNIFFGVFGVLTRLVFKGITLFIWYAIYAISPFKIEASAFTILLLFLLNEFVYYWFHRISHEVPFFWATHVNHHSSVHLNFSVAARTPFLNAIYHCFFWIPLPLLGFHPIDILLVETLSFFFAFAQHTTLIPKLGILEWFLNTPSHHRVHHASNPEYINKNYGNVLIIYDRLFRTFKEEKATPIYGLTKNPINRGLINMIFHGWKDLFYKNSK